MIHLILVLLATAQTFAGEGEGHSHRPVENVGPIVIIIAVLIAAGVIFHFVSKKKK